eukprot:scaffold27438_cov108-Isochrysis_galbana.AAC.3
MPCTQCIMRRVGAFAALRCVLLSVTFCGNAAAHTHTHNTHIILFLLAFCPLGVFLKKADRSAKAIKLYKLRKPRGGFSRWRRKPQQLQRSRSRSRPWRHRRRRSGPVLTTPKRAPHPRMCATARARAPAIAACKLADLHMHYALRTTHNRAWAIGPPGALLYLFLY